MIGSFPLVGGVALGIDFEKLVGFAMNGGFAIFVACWLLFKTDKVVSDNTKAFAELTNVLAALLRRDGVALRRGMGGQGAEGDTELFKPFTKGG